MRELELLDPQKAREALRLTERQRDVQRGAAVTAEATVALTPGKATLAGAYAASAAMMDPIGQVCRSMSCATADVASLEEANRSGDLMRALWVVALVKRFVAQVPALLAMVGRNASVEFEAHVQALLERARVALDHAPTTSAAAREAADRGDYRQWDADLEPWFAKARASREVERDGEGGPRRKPVAVVELGKSPKPALADVTHQARAAAVEPASESADPASAAVEVDRTGEAAVTDIDEHNLAARGTTGAGDTLPHLETIQRAFGRHDVSSVRAYVGGNAAKASHAFGASAYAYGDSIAFGSAPDLHTAAHEAAHVVQQRKGVLRRLGGDNSYEVHADLVADRVVRGRSAEALLDGFSGSGRAAPLVQLKKAGSSAPSNSASVKQRSDSALGGYEALLFEALTEGDVPVAEFENYMRQMEEQDLQVLAQRLSVTPAPATDRLATAFHQTVPQADRKRIVSWIAQTVKTHRDDRMWSELAPGESSESVQLISRVDAPKGVCLRSQPSAGKDGALLPFGTLVAVSRKTEKGWYFVTVIPDTATEGAEPSSVPPGACGFVESYHVASSMPEPMARLHMDQTHDQGPAAQERGEGIAPRTRQGDAGRHQGRHASWPRSTSRQAAGRQTNPTASRRCAR